MTVNVAVTDHDGNVVLFKRARDKKPYPSKWSWPGGGVKTDEKPVKAAKRELLEETGLKLKKKDLTLISVTQRGDGKLHVYFMCVVDESLINSIELNDEHSAYELKHPDDINDAKMHPRIAQRCHDGSLGDGPVIAAAVS